MEGGALPPAVRRLVRSRCCRGGPPWPPSGRRRDQGEEAVAGRVIIIVVAIVIAIVVGIVVGMAWRWGGRTKTMIATRIGTTILGDGGYA